MKLTRRQFSALSAAMAAFGTPGRAQEAEPGMTLGARAEFAPDDVIRQAETLAARAYQPPVQVPEAWRNLKYDEYRHMWFDTRNALWRRRGRAGKGRFLPARPLLSRAGRGLRRVGRVGAEGRI